MKFKCDCCNHILEISYDKKFKCLDVGIFEVYGKYRKYKKPKLMADVVIMDNHYPKELTKLKKFLKKIVKEIKE